MREILITDREQGQRIDKFLMKYMSLAPKSFIYKMLRKKNIKLNKSKTDGSEILKTGDTIALYLSDETIESFISHKRVKKADISFDIIYEDKNIIVCSKPAGLIVHPDKEHNDNTLNDQLLYYLSTKNEYNSENSMGFVPSICNRLDLNTSGIVTMGKNLSAVQELNRGFKERLIDKYYLAVVKGEVKKEGTIRGYHTKGENNIAYFSETDKGGSPICTHYRPIDINDGYTLLEVKLETGKSHQIRLCMQHAGFPVIGDRKYGDTRANKYFYDNFGVHNQLLHSYRLVLNMDDGYLSYLKGKELKAPVSDPFNKVICKKFINYVEKNNRIGYNHK